MHDLGETNEGGIARQVELLHQHVERALAVPVVYSAPSAS
jgi:hypothetical protein